MNLVWRAGRIGGAEALAFRSGDPAARGLGLFETMRAADGDVPWLDDHLDRMLRSARDLGLDGFPPRGAIESAVSDLLAAAGPGEWRVRITAGDAPSLVVDLGPVPAPSAAGASAVTDRGAWDPSRALAEHKTTSYGAHLLAQRRAEAREAQHALLLDAAGRLGEAAVANAFCVVDGDLMTAPARGLLPGVARARVLAAAEAIERAPEEEEWRAATEVFLTNALRGVIPVIRIDGRPVGEGSVGPLTSSVAEGLVANG